MTLIGWRGVDVFGERFADLAEVREAGGETSGAAVFDETTGAITLTPVAPAPTGTLTMFEDSDSGTFGYTDPFVSDFGFSCPTPINANSTQLVLVTALASGDTGIAVGSDTLPTPWVLQVQNVTTDPSGLSLVGNCGSGPSWAQVGIWATNTTDADADHTISVSVKPTCQTIDSGCGVTVTVRTLYYA